MPNCLHICGWAATKSVCFLTFIQMFLRVVESCGRFLLDLNLSAPPRLRGYEKNSLLQIRSQPRAGHVRRGPPAGAERLPAAEWFPGTVLVRDGRPHARPVAAGH